MQFAIFYSRLILLAACLVMLSGCATTDEDTDMPWNAPKQWEGSPSIPGLPTYQ